MGRTEPTVVKPPAAFRRDARAKRARATINKVIPALLSAHPRARRGIERSELIVDPPPLHQRESEHDEGKKVWDDGSWDGVKEGRKVSGARSGGRRKKKNLGDEQSQEKSARRRDETKVTSDTRCVNSPRITLCVADTLTAAQSLLQQQHHQQHQQQYSREERTAETARAPDFRLKVGILNMASPLSPGGGFLNGATSQEESLCMRTTLLPALRDEFYRMPELAVVYTPDVLVFRPASSSPSPSSFSSSPSASPSPSSDRRSDASGSGGGGEGDENDILPKNDRWFVDVVSAAALRLPETESGRYASAADRELVVRKMRAVLRVFAAKGCTRVVLGAWGCGAYGNPVPEIAKAWRQVLAPDPVVEGEGEKGRDRTSNARAQGASNGEEVKGKGKGAKDKKSRNGSPERWGAFIEDVVFAINDGSMAAAFARAFGEDVLPLPTSLSGHGEHGSLSSTAADEDEDPVEVARTSELREKIAQLEIRAEQARSPQLQAGLEAVLAGLRKQVALQDDDEASSALAQESSDGLDDEGEEYD
ncbi:hypothetical protein F4824DRAFT_505180 [Ustulina deusta]|nr:hypothetical protein F4824DRAFT_505180 [Ustulina deusta]